MKIRDIMRRDAATVGPDDHLSTALQIMLWSGARHLPVVDGGKLVGVLSERDILRFRAEHAGGGMDAPVRDSMTKPPRFVDPDEPVAAAAGMMADDKVGCLPVVALGEPIGIVTATDVLRALEQTDFAGAPEPAELAARDLMTTEVINAAPGDTLANAAARMAMYRVRHLPVVDTDRRLIGMLSDRDLRQRPLALQAPGSREAALDLEQTTVGQVMSVQPFHVRPDATVSELATAFADWRVSALPVVDDAGHVLGMLSYVDMMRGMKKPSERPQRPRPESGAAPPPG